jgi:hypothetical protein
MISVLNFEKFVDLKDSLKSMACIFLLNNEYKFLEEEHHWIGSIQEKIYLVRMSKDEFRTMDIGIHPKFIVFKYGEESYSSNGVPTLNKIRDTLGG